MKNPFFFGRTVYFPSFINRAKEIEYLTKSLERGQNVILFSPRRYGKTSLIKIVLEKLKKQGLEVFYIDLYRTTTLEKFYRSYMDLIINQITSPASKLFSLMRSIIPSLKPKLVFSEPDKPSLELEFSRDEIVKTKTLNEMFDFIEIYLTKKKKKGCVVFDEFQEICSIIDGEDLEREMRSSFQHHTHVTYAFLGSKNHLMNELFSDKSRPFYNFGSRYELDVINSEDWTKYIIQQFQKGGYSIDTAACEEIIRLTDCHPYYTQFFCSDLWDKYYETKKIAKTHLKQALQEVLQKEAHAYQEIWDSINGKQRKLLEAIALEPDPEIFSNTFISKHYLSPLSSMQRTLQKLIKRDLIIKKNGKYRFVDPFFRLWLSDKQ